MEISRNNPLRLLVRLVDSCKVNAANGQLYHGGGVAMAIAQAGGRQSETDRRVIQDESIQFIRKNGPLEVGQACSTSAGNLKCKYVIHTVGPMFKEKYNYSQEKMLAKAFLSALKKAEELRVKSIALPAISSGIFGFPKVLVAQILFQEVLKYKDESSLQELHFTNFDELTANIFADEFDRVELKNEI